MSATITPRRIGHTFHITPSQLRLGARVGYDRELNAVIDGRTHRAGYGNAPAWDNHVEGAIGEMVLAKAFGLFWDGTVDTFTSCPDVGVWQVRTALKPDGALVIRPGDADGERFALVTRVKPLVYCVVGWLYADDAKRAEWLEERNGRAAAWFVPHDFLKRFVVASFEPIKLAPRSMDLREW